VPRASRPFEFQYIKYDKFNGNKGIDTLCADEGNDMRDDGLEVFRGRYFFSTLPEGDNGSYSANVWYMQDTKTA
jgi:hypothetical protein